MGFHRHRGDRRRGKGVERFDNLEAPDDCFGTSAGKSFLRAASPRRPVPAEIDFLRLVVGRLDAGQEARPLFVWGKYFDTHNNLCDLGFLKETRNCRLMQIGDFAITPDISRETGGKGCRAKLETARIYFYENSFARGVLYDTDPIKTPHIPLKYLPDLLLRRASSIFFDQSHQDLGVLKGHHALRRHGIVFNGITQSDSKSGRVVQEAADAPFEQTPFVVPGFLEQDDIDRIVSLVWNFQTRCAEKGFPVLWPPVGTWPDWPENFTKFSKLIHRDIDLPWYGHTAQQDPGIVFEPL